MPAKRYFVNLSQEEKEDACIYIRKTHENIKTLQKKGCITPVEIVSKNMNSLILCDSKR